MKQKKQLVGIPKNNPKKFFQKNKTPTSPRLGPRSWFVSTDPHEKKEGLPCLVGPGLFFGDEMPLPRYIPVTQMTLVLIVKDLLLEGSNPKIEDKQVPGRDYFISHCKDPVINQPGFNGK